MKDCIDCGQPITFSQDKKTKSGKFIPLNAGDLKPHDCPIKKLKFILDNLNTETTHAHKMAIEAVKIAMESIKKYGIGEPKQIDLYNHIDTYMA